MAAYINYISSYLPKNVRTNEDIANRHPEWSVEKISLKVGIEQRHLAGEDETAGDMAFLAAEKLIIENKINREDIDYVILCTQSPDYMLPSTACVLQHRLGLPKHCGAFDFDLGCSGYVYGLGIAKGFILSGQAKRVLLLTAETYNKYISDEDKGNKTIFGDGATATLVTTESIGGALNYEIGNFTYGTDGSGAESLIVRNGASRHPIHDGNNEYDEEGNFVRNDNHIYMDGKAIFNFTAFEVPKLVKDNLISNGMAKEEIDLFVFHQANAYMLDTVRKRCGIDATKFFVDIKTVGNTVSNSIPIAMVKANEQGVLKDAKHILISGFGVGLSMAAAILNKQ
jgi:3-oxoacyl-[acyl-carrier-protein] synthase-3